MLLVLTFAVIFLSDLLQSSAEAMTKRCQMEGIEIIDLNQTTSVVTFNITVNDPVICGNRRFNVLIRLCNSTKLDGIHCRPKAGLGTCPVVRNEKNQLLEVTWALAAGRRGSARAVVSDRCFNLLGREASPEPFEMDFEETFMELTFLKPDARVESWNVTVYEVEKDFPKEEEEESGDTTCPNREPNHLDNRIPENEWLKISNNSRLRLEYKFALEVCYCFQVLPIGYNGTRLRSKSNFISNIDCRPRATYIISPKIPEDTLGWKVPLITAFCALLIIVAIIVVKRRFFAYEIHNLRETATDEGLYFSKTGQDLLVIYAHHSKLHDDQVNQLVGTLKRNVCNNGRKVYDIHEACVDEDRIADPNEWLRKRIESDKVLVILSPTLNLHLRDTFNAKTGVARLNENDSTLVYGLRVLLSKSDYSKLYMARFSNENQDNNGAIDLNDIYSEAMVQRRRYKLPEQKELLMSSLL